MADKSYTVLNAMVDIVASPGKALEEVKLHTAWLWWPLLISMALACGLLAWYYSWVDFEWFIEHTIQSIPAEDRAASEGAIRSFMSPTISIGTSVAVIVIMTFVIYLLLAVYYHLANKLTTGSDISFGQWFSFAAWTNFVSVFGSIAGFIVILMAGSNQLPAENLQVLSFNALFIHAQQGDPWFTWGSFLSLIHFWTIFLASIGFARWTDSSMAKSVTVAALPWVLIFGVWALMI
jgi:hypothetical protein